MATAEDTGWADNVDYGDSDDDDGLNAKMEMSKTDDEDEDDNQDNNWADDVDYGDDNDDDDDDGIGDLDLSDDDGLDDDLPQTGGPMGSPMGASNFKSEITSTLDNPNKIGISYKLILDPRDTPGDISDDDETAPGLRINHFQLLSSKQMAQENKGNILYIVSIISDKHYV